MTRRRSLELIVLFLSIATLANGQATPTVDQMAKNSPCSNIVALSQAKVDCSALTPEQQKILKSIPSLLKKILDKEPDLTALKAEMDQMYALVQASSPSAGALISIDHNSNGNDISGTRIINGQLKIAVDNQSGLNSIRDSEVLTIPETSCYFDDPQEQLPKYKETSNAELRDGVIKFANELRVYARDVEQEEEDGRAKVREELPTEVLQKMTPEQIGKMGREAAVAYRKRQENLTLAITEKFSGQATEYRDVLRWRLKEASLLQSEPILRMSRTLWPFPGGAP
jgi:hypothetical protein